MTEIGTHYFDIRDLGFTYEETVMSWDYECLAPMRSPYLDYECYAIVLFF